MTGAFSGKAVHDALFVAIILPLDAWNYPQVGLHGLHQTAADALHIWFAVLLRRLFAEQTASVDVRLDTEQIYIVTVISAICCRNNSSGRNSNSSSC